MNTTEAQRIKSLLDNNEMVAIEILKQEAKDNVQLFEDKLGTLYTFKDQSVIFATYRKEAHGKQPVYEAYKNYYEWNDDVPY